MVKELAYAKVNLFLNVLDKRKDGYHNLEMVNAKIDLFDTITLEASEDAELVMIRSNDLFLSNQNNIVFNVAKAFLNRYKPESGVMITIDKNIPFGAGLGGNSADAASIIKGLNTLFDLKLTQQEMIEFGLPFGADIPYCLSEGVAFVEGIGEKISLFDIDLSKKEVLLLHPKIFVSTKDAFVSGDEEGFLNRDAKAIKEALTSNEASILIKEMHNSLQKITFSQYPKVKEAYDLLKRELGDEGLLMTGSGSTIIKIVDKSDETVKKFVQDFGEKYFLHIYCFL